MGSGNSKSKNRTLLRETLIDHDDSINCMCVSEDGSILVTGSDDKTARMWMAGSQETECLGILRGHTQYITCVTVTDTFVITGSADNTIRKWDVTSCDCLAVYGGHTSRIIRIICTGDFIFSTSTDRTAKAWAFDVPVFDDEDGDAVECIRNFEGHKLGVIAIIYIPGDDPDDKDNDEEVNINPGDVIITASADSTARAWSFASGQTIKIFKGHKSAISCMSTDSEGVVLYTGSMDKTIRSWNIRTGECTATLEGHLGSILCLHVFNKLMYSGSSDNTARCWVRNFDVCACTYKGHMHSVSCIRFHEGYLFTASGDACARAYDAKSGKVKAVFRGHTSAITCMCLLDKYLYTGSSDKTLRVWDASRVTLESEELMEAMGEENEDEVETTKELDDFERKLSGYIQDDVDPSSKPATLKPPSPSQGRQSRLLTPTPSGRSRLSPSPTPSGRSRMSVSPSPSGRSRVSPSPSRPSKPSNNDPVAMLTQELDI